MSDPLDTSKALLAFLRKPIDDFLHLVKFDYHYGDEWIDPLVLPNDLKEWLEKNVGENGYEFSMTSYIDDPSKACIFLWFKDEQVALLAKLTWS